MTGAIREEATYRRLRERCDTVLVGRVSYEGFFGYWPKVTDDPKASASDVAISSGALLREN